MILVIEHTKPENNSRPLIGTITSIYLQYKGKHLVRTWSRESTTPGPDSGT